MKGQIKRFILRALARMSGVPMPEAALIDSVRLLVPTALRTDVIEAVKELDQDGLICGNRDEVSEIVTWTLTDKGTHKAKQLE